MVEPVKSRPMAAGAMDLIALVDCQVWSLAGEFDDGVAFLGAKLASSGTKSLHTRKWVTLPEDVDLA